MVPDSLPLPAVVDVSGCWALLRTAQVGRLAVSVGNEPDIFPVNFAVDHGSIVFRTAEGTKLAALTVSPTVAFEADGYSAEENEAWSVVVKGRAQEIRGQFDLLDSMALPVFPWQAGPKPRSIRIVPDSITGRRFTVAQPGQWSTPLSGKPKAPPE
jgi:hypothetical protein